MSEIDELKLKRVVLFKVGIGSFQKYGKINLKTSKTVKVSFRNTVMNDLLKTFSIVRLSGDMLISGVSYEAHNTNRAKILENSDINLPEANSFSALIKQLRGVSVKIQHQETITEGKIIGIQSFAEAPTGQAIINQEYVMLALESQEIKPIPVAKITGLDILDQKIKQDFQFFLETITGQNKEKNKVVTLFFKGEETSEYLLNFLQEVPAWKTSYRIFLKDEEDATVKKEAKFDISLDLQGWAIIDNVLDEDWKDVDLTLVTGLPVSFIYDSYSPAWIQRPMVERKTDLGIKVMQFEKSMGPPSSPPGGPPMARAPSPRRTKKAKFRSMEMAGMGALSSGMSDMMDGDYFAEEEELCEEPAPEAAFEEAADAEGGKGLAFKYHIKNPVYVKRNNSSLIPLLQSEMPGRMLSVYNKSVNEKHPLRTLEFNNSGATLEEGPISIFIDNNFAGEAMLPFLEETAQCRIPFAIDQGVKITVDRQNATKNVHEIRILDEIHARYFSATSTTYKIQNLSDAPRFLIIEHPKSHRYKFFETKDPDEMAPSVYRFFIEIKAKESQELLLKERRLDTRLDDAEYLAPNIVKRWLDMKLIKKAEFDYLMKRIELEEERKSINSEMINLDQRKTTIIQDQDRLRENVRSLKKSKAEEMLREKYIKKLDAQENELEKIVQRLDELKEELSKLDEKISKYTVQWNINRKEKAEKEEKK